MTTKKTYKPDVPLCAQELGCYCAGHARGNPATDPCDTNERPDLINSSYERLVADRENSFR